MKTILITGSSSGIGKATALYFQERGWNVSATMRRPHMKERDNVICPRLDVTDAKTIKKAVDETIKSFGRIDVVLNNAGYGCMGALEAVPMDKIEKQYDVNYFGLIKVIKGSLPHLKKSKGTIINVSSVVGRLGFPLGSVYSSSKFAVEGLSESLMYELEQFGIKVKVIEPGSIDTDFSGRSMDRVSSKKYMEIETSFTQSQKSLKSDHPSKVAKVIYKAATDNSGKLRYPAAGGAPMMMFLRNIMPDRVIFWVFRKMMG